MKRNTWRTLTTTYMIFITDSQPLQIYPQRNESHSCCDIPVLNTLSQLGLGSLSTLFHTSRVSAADLQTDVLLSTSASPKIHKLILAQTDTSVCVGLGEEESAWCLKSLQQAIPSAWAQLGGIPNSSVQSQHFIVFPRHLRCNTCFAAVERQESAPETNTVPPETSTLGSARTAGSSCTRILSKLNSDVKLSCIIAFLSSSSCSTTSEQHPDASQYLTSPSTPGRRGFIPTTLAWWLQPSWM